MFLIWYNHPCEPTLLNTEGLSTFSEFWCEVQHHPPNHQHPIKKKKKNKNTHIEVNRRHIVITCCDWYSSSRHFKLNCIWWNKVTMASSNFFLRHAPCKSLNRKTIYLPCFFLQYYQWHIVSKCKLLEPARRHSATSDVIPHFPFKMS